MKAVLVRAMIMQVALAAVTLAACAQRDPIGPPLTQLPRQLSRAEQQLIAADNEFAFRLLRATLEHDPASINHFVSPLSASMALGMTLNGAAGATADSMRATLGFGALAMADVNAGYRGLIDLLAGLDRAVTWELANSIWYRDSYTFRQSFLDTTRRYFDADARALDFASPAAGPTINQWVRDRTQSRITSIVPEPLPRDAIMYLINAIYFKGTWTTRFDPARTQNAPFRLGGGGTASVPMMSAADMPLRMGTTDGVTVVELPYSREAFAMTIALPPEGVTVDSLARNLTRATWDRWTSGLSNGEVLFEMPKFRIEYLIQLNQPLENMGMGIAFCASGQFDFSNMDPAGEACIFDVRQKTFVLVDEAGTEAAAVTSVGVGVTSAPMPLRVDRPFLFAIRERLSGTILFLGVVRDPR